MNSTLASFLEQHQTRINSALGHYLGNVQKSDQPLHKAMRYSLLAGGKRIRPILAYAGACAVGQISQSTDRIGCALECVHAYSLIHDDLPAMDDDQLRRGKPTCHIAFDEATAILAGDALQALAFEIVTDAEELTAETRLKLVQQLAQASGGQGMVLGQAIDLGAVNQSLTLDQLQNMHAHKTGALIKASILMGAVGTERVSASQLQALSAYADAVGLAFQVQDDILDITADTETLGKQQGADERLNKPTYPALLGLDGARQKAQQLHLDALEALKPFDSSADTLRYLSAYIVERQH